MPRKSSAQHIVIYIYRLYYTMGSSKKDIVWYIWLSFKYDQLFGINSHIYMSSQQASQWWTN